VIKMLAARIAADMDGIGSPPWPTGSALFETA
jgi:hypothetical protein